jgi:Papain fold toxin 1, glutamine deamidase
MNRPIRYAGQSAVAITLAYFPSIARADNCSGLGDCFDAAQWAAIAIAAVVLAAVAVALLPELIGGAAAAGELGELGVLTGGAELGAGAELGIGAEAGAGAGAEAAAGGELGSVIDLGLPDINAVGGTDNCAQAVSAVERWLGGGGGNLPSYAADIGPTNLTMDNLAGELGGNWSGNTSLADIGTWLENSGDGARGVVYVEENGFAHVFNAVNINGSVVGIDAQSGIYGSLQTVSSAGGYGNPVSVLFLPTFP